MSVCVRYTTCTTIICVVKVHVGRVYRVIQRQKQILDPKPLKPY
jgi:hypothetical protein